MKKLKLYLVLATVIAVAGGAIALGTNVVAAHTRTVRIKVDTNGFSPSTIEVVAGHKLNLVFNRTSRNNCGSTVVFPKLNIRKTLPLGKEVIVSFTPSSAGQITFSCGTGTHKGSVVISEE